MSTFRLRLHSHVILLYFQMFGLDLWSLSEFLSVIVDFCMDLIFFFFFTIEASLA